MSEMRDRMMENLKRLNEIRNPVKTPEMITRAEAMAKVAEMEKTYMRAPDGMEDLFSKIQKIEARLKEMA